PSAGSSPARAGLRGRRGWRVGPRSDVRDACAGRLPTTPDPAPGAVAGCVHISQVVRVSLTAGSDVGAAVAGCVHISQVVRVPLTAGPRRGDWRSRRDGARSPP